MFHSPQSLQIETKLKCRSANFTKNPQEGFFTLNVSINFDWAYNGGLWRNIFGSINKYPTHLSQKYYWAPTSYFSSSIRDVSDILSYPYMKITRPMTTGLSKQMASRLPRGIYNIFSNFYHWLRVGYFIYFGDHKYFLWGWCQNKSKRGAPEPVVISPSHIKQCNMKTAFCSSRWSPHISNPFFIQHSLRHVGLWDFVIFKLRNKSCKIGQQPPPPPPPHHSFYIRHRFAIYRPTQVYHNMVP